jgi:hypothetical protein
MRRVLATLAAKLLKLKTLRGLFLILCGEVVAILALSALENDFISHNSLSEKMRSLEPDRLLSDLKQFTQ